MPDYEAMYKQLFNTASKAIELLQEAQREAEEMYVSGEEAEREENPSAPSGRLP